MWGLPKRRQRSVVLDAETAIQVIDWWSSQTRVSPQKKDVVNKWLAPKEYEQHATHFLIETQTTFFLRFKEENPELKVQERAFIKLRPYFVRSLKERDVCCCIFHVETQMMNEGLSRMRDRMLGVHREHINLCVCPVCQPARSDGSEGCLAHLSVYKGTTALWESCVCPKEELDLWHDRKCLLGECGNCGVDRKLMFCPNELDMETTDTFKWRRFEKTEVGVNNETGLPRLILQEAYKETTPPEFVKYMKITLQKFIKHNYVARW